MKYATGICGTRPRRGRVLRPPVAADSRAVPEEKKIKRPERAPTPRRNDTHGTTATVFCARAAYVTPGPVVDVLPLDAFVNLNSQH